MRYRLERWINAHWVGIGYINNPDTAKAIRDTLNNHTTEKHRIVSERTVEERVVL